METDISSERKTGLKLGIKGKLILLFLVLTVSITGVLSVISFISGSSSISSEATAKLAAIAELKTSNLETFIFNRFGEIHVMTGLDVLKQRSDDLIAELRKSNLNPSLPLEVKRKYLKRNSLNYRLLDQYLNKYFKALGNYSEMKFVAAFNIKNRKGQTIFKEGDQVLSVGGFKGNTKNKTMYQGALELMKNKKTGADSAKYNCPLLYTSSIEWCGELKKPSIHMSHGLGRYGLSMKDLKKNTPVKERFSLVMIFDINISALDKLLQDRTGMGESGETYLANREGERITMLTGSRFEKDTSLKKDLSKIKGLMDHFRHNEFRRGAEFCKNVIYENYQGEKVLSHNHMLKIGDNRLAVITEMHENEIFKSASELLVLMLIIGLVVLVGASGVALFFSRSMAKPIVDSAQIAETIADGDLTMAINNKYLNRGDEIGSLLRSLDGMSGKLNQLISTIMINSENLVHASDQVSSTAVELSNGSNEQAANVEEISSSLQEISSAISQNAQNAKDTNMIAQTSTSQAKEGGRAVENTVEAMNNIAEKIGIIQDIAYQTNLLALNAAIEAARAGESGKGFAVVAGEVRKLAEKSHEASKEISEMVDSSLSITNEAGSLMNEIVESIDKTAQLVQDISAASEQQDTGVGQIASGMNQLNSITQENASSSEELASTSDVLKTQAMELQDVVSFFKTKNDSRSDKLMIGESKKKSDKSEG